MELDVIQQFQTYQQELDAKHNKWERIVKLSRDITIESKRLIFLLHRIDIFSLDHSVNSEILCEAKQKVQILSKKWEHVASELKNEDGHAYIRAFSPGLQEYIEAMSFLHYFNYERNYEIGDISNCLITIDELQKSLTFQSGEEIGPCIPIPVLEYLLGIADTTGEMMRLCINSASKVSSDVTKVQVFKLCAFVRVLYEMFLSFSSIIDDTPSRKKFLRNKVEVMKSSLQKVEDTCYQLGIRDKELLDPVLRSSHVLEESAP